MSDRGPKHAWQAALDFMHIQNPVPAHEYQRKTCTAQETGCWGTATRIFVTVILYAFISLSIFHKPPVVVYTCSDGNAPVAPRAVNTRWNTIFETIPSPHNHKNEAYFCKVETAMDMVRRYPDRTIIYVDSDSVVDMKTLIRDGECDRLTLGIHPLRNFVETSFFCFRANAKSLDMLRQWWEIRDDYPKYAGGLHDQGAMHDLINSRTTDFKVSMVDPTGIQIAHCSHAVRERRAECKQNLGRFSYWDRTFVLVFSVVKFVIWLMPLSLTFGFPLVLSGALSCVFNLNPLTILGILGIPSVFSPWHVRNNLISGALPLMYNRMFSGLVWLRIGSMGVLWLPGVGMIRFPRDHMAMVGSLAYLVLITSMILFRKRLDSWTCLTCPTLYHWLTWSQDGSKGRGSLTGAGHWLKIVSAAPNEPCLEVDSKKLGEAGVAVSAVKNNCLSSDKCSLPRACREMRLSERLKRDDQAHV